MTSAEKPVTDPIILPLFPLRDVVVLPYQVVPLYVGRPRSVAALIAAAEEDRQVIVVAQRQARIQDPGPEDLHAVGTQAVIAQMLKLPDGSVRVLVEGQRRVQIRRVLTDRAHYRAEAVPMDEGVPDTFDTDAARGTLLAAVESFLEQARRAPREALKTLAEVADLSRLVDQTALVVDLKLDDRQALLEIGPPADRVARLLEILARETETLQAERRLRARQRKSSDRPGEGEAGAEGERKGGPGGEPDEFKAELRELEEAIEAVPLSDEARAKARKEMKKLRMMPPMSAESTVVRNYLDWVVSLPWATYTEDNRDILRAREVLDEDHHALEKVKERVLEYLAVQTLVGQMKGPILCFVGPPGVGKTSLARSIARATGRKFVRCSLGGVRDEAEIRGHRRTYIGALPGKLLQSLKKAGANNPVFLLDEIDKLSSDYRGDPSSALLEALDPEQNHAFADHYLELDYDLSKVLFIATANHLSGIPPALRDRLEVIHLEGYTDEEKLEIARRYLVPKQIEANGLAGHEPPFSEGVLRAILDDYTREAGVRNLEREIATICRKLAVKLLEQRSRNEPDEGPMPLAEGDLGELLGVPRYRRGPLEDRDLVGMATGLAWTEVGGEVLQIEASLVPGKGNLRITGKLGEVMQESAQAALTYVRARGDALGIPKERFQESDIHVHVPEGATPKDGPSAGITMAVALVSAITGLPVPRDLAMTGEITLRGRVLAVGGLKEKLLAAYRATIRAVLIPADNEKDLRDVPQALRDALDIVPVGHMDEVLAHARMVRDRADAEVPAAVGVPVAAGSMGGLN